jgi:hypothetical protein
MTYNLTINSKENEKQILHYLLNQPGVVVVRNTSKKRTIKQTITKRFENICEGENTSQCASVDSLFAKAGIKC